MHSFIKPTNGHDYSDDGTRTDLIQYYQESEWRYVPTDSRVPRDGPAGGMLLKTFKEKYHPVTRSYSMLHFGPEDIQHIIVEKNDEIDHTLGYLEICFPKATAVVMKRLLSKVKSFQSLDDDH